MQYDVVVIGGGPGGYVAAIRAAQNNLKTCLIESTWIGGTCLNEGCIPTKTLLRSAEILEDVKRSAEFGVKGVDPKAVSISIADMQARKKAVINQLQSGIKALLRRGKVTVISDTAKLTGAHTVMAGNETIEAKNIIIATGSIATLPRFIKCSDPSKIISSRELLSMEEYPDTIIIIGGGVVGMEFASLLNTVGKKVIVVEALKEIMPTADAEVAKLTRECMAKKGIEFHLDTKVLEIAGENVYVECSGKKETLKAPAILVAIGRKPNTESINAADLGIKMDKGAICVNKYMQTNIPHIYAIGDVNGTNMLAHMASHEGIVAIDHIMGGDMSVEGSQVPSCIYTVPEIAQCGLTEQQAKEASREFNVGRFPMMANGKALIEGYSEGLMKVITDRKTGEIIGVHLCGPHAAEMIGGMGALMTAEVTTAEMAYSVFPHPSVSETIGEAFLAAEGKAVHC